MEVLLTKEYIIGLLEKKGMTKAKFAEAMGIVRQNLDALLDSKKKDINTVIRMSEVLDIPFTVFIGMADKKTDIHGCIYVNGRPNLVTSKEEIEILLKKL